MVKPSPENVEWTRRQIMALGIGGLWGVPRSGLMIQRTSPIHVELIDCMPWAPGMPFTQAELQAHQKSDWEEIKAHIVAAGFTVVERIDA